MLENIKAKAKAGADAAERSAKATKLKADIMLIENKLKTVKMEFGKDVYPAMAAGDRNTTETLFMTTKAPPPPRVGPVAAVSRLTRRVKGMQDASGGLVSLRAHSRVALPRRQSLDIACPHRRPRWRAWRRRLLRRGPRSRGSRLQAAATATAWARRWGRRRAAQAFRRRLGRHLALLRLRACPRAGKVRPPSLPVRRPRRLRAVCRVSRSLSPDVRRGDDPRGQGLLLPRADRPDILVAAHRLRCQGRAAEAVRARSWSRCLQIMCTSSCR